MRGGRGGGGERKDEKLLCCNGEESGQWGAAQVWGESSGDDLFIFFPGGPQCFWTCTSRTFLIWDYPFAALLMLFTVFSSYWQHSAINGKEQVSWEEREERLIASEKGGGGGVTLGASQEAPVAALPLFSNLALRHNNEEREKRLGWVSGWGWRLICF